MPLEWGVFLANPIKELHTFFLDRKDPQKETNKILNRRQSSVFFVSIRLFRLLFLLLFYLLQTVVSCFLWNRVVPVSSPRMAAEYSADCQIKALDGTVFAECLKGILGTCRGETAAWGLERRNAYLIESYQENEWKGKDFPNAEASLTHWFPACLCLLNGWFFQLRAPQLRGSADMSESPC